MSEMSVIPTGVLTSCAPTSIRNASGTPPKRILRLEGNTDVKDNSGRSIQGQTNAFKNATLLAMLDWVGAPTSVILEELTKLDGEPYAPVTITNLRDTDAYKEMSLSLKETWQKNLLEPCTGHSVRSAAGAILTSSLKRIMEMVTSRKASLKDIIAAARLTAQITGNIVTADEGDGRNLSEKQESIASELVTAMQRIKAEKETVQ